jgi:gamma-tubulin complex component 5
MDTYTKWHDYHILNSTFRDAAAIGPKSWIDPHRVQLSYRPTSLTASRSRSVRALNGLFVRYSLPFPLDYIPREQYSRVFVFLLQIRRAKSLMDHTLLRVLPRAEGTQAFYVMRSRLLWFIKCVRIDELCMLLKTFCSTIHVFITLNVIHVQHESLRAELKEAGSLDAIIGTINSQ